MGFRCLLGHDFGEPELEREREERGDEVIITVNEVKTCTRCGERQIVSENTEVTSLDQLTETASDETVSEPPAAEQAAAPSTASPERAESVSTAGISLDETEPTTEDAEVWTDDDDEPEDLGTATTANMTVDDVEAAAAEPASPGDETDTVDVEAETDDGVILSDKPSTSDEDAERELGEWPEYETGKTATEDDSGEWPTPKQEDEGFGAEEPTDPPEDMTFGGGFTPEITDDIEVADDEDELSFTRAEEATVEYEPTVDDIQTEFYCPECELARQAGNSSMRAGDICPECKRGYISERPL